MLALNFLEKQQWSSQFVRVHASFLLLTPCSMAFNCPFRIVLEMLFRASE